MRNLIQ